MAAVVSHVLGLEERPIILFDTHPQPPPSFVQDSWTRFSQHLSTAWTGVVHWEVSYGQLRVLWFTIDGKQGKRDYELRESETVQLAFEKLAGLPDVSRAMVLGYASQNPYVMDSQKTAGDKKDKERDSRGADAREQAPLLPRAEKAPVGIAVDKIIEDDEREELTRHEYGREDV